MALKDSVTQCIAEFGEMTYNKEAVTKWFNDGFGNCPWDTDLFGNVPFQKALDSEFGLLSLLFLRQGRAYLAWACHHSAACSNVADPLKKDIKRTFFEGEKIKDAFLKHWVNLFLNKNNLETVSGSTKASAAEQNKINSLEKQLDQFKEKLLQANLKLKAAMEKCEQLEVENANLKAKFETPKTTPVKSKTGTVTKSKSSQPGSRPKSQTNMDTPSLGLLSNAHENQVIDGQTFKALQQEKAILEVQVEAYNRMAEDAMASKILERINTRHQIGLPHQPGSRYIQPKPTQKPESQATEQVGVDHGDQFITYSTALQRGRERSVSRTRQQKSRAPKQKNVPKEYIVVAEPLKSDKVSSSELFTRVKDVLSARYRQVLAKVTISRLKELKEGLVLIVTPSEKDQLFILETLKKDNFLGFEVRKYELRRPLIKIFGVDGSRKPDEVGYEIIRHNIRDEEDRSPTDEEIQQSIKYLYKKKSWYGGRNSNCVDLVFEIKPEYEGVLLAKKSLKIDFQVVQVTSLVRLVQCFRCCAYGHTQTRCPLKNEGKSICPYCAGAHPMKECQARKNPETYTCINCTNFNSNLHPTSTQKVQTNHSVLDKKCPMRVKAAQRNDLATHHASSLL